MDRDGADLSGGHHRTSEWRIFGEREVCVCRILILGIFGQHASRMGLPSHHQMVEALAPDGADQSFDKAIPPRRAGRDLPVANAHGAKPSPEDDAIHTVTVADQVTERLIPGECLRALSDLFDSSPMGFFLGIGAACDSAPKTAPGSDPCPPPIR
jgi:hypothetical protein